MKNRLVERLSWSDSGSADPTRVETIMPDLRPLRSLALGAPLFLSTACFDPLIVDDAPSATDGTGTDDAASTAPASSGLDESGDDPPVCGDGVVDGDEVCDDGINDGRYGGCAPGCAALGPSCGDGIVNGGEPCDDGDTIDGNGCNVDCVISGTVLWTVTYDGPGHGVDSAGGIAVDSSDNVVVSGTVALEDGSYAAWVRKYTPDGAAAWTEFFSGPMGDSAAGSLTVLDDDSIVFGGSFDTGDPQSSVDSWVHRLAANGQTLWSVTHGSTLGGYDYIHSVGHDDSDAIYVLFDESLAPTPSGTRSFVRKYTADGVEIWTTTLQDGISSRAMAVTGDGTWSATGSIPAKEDPFIPHLELHTSDGTTIFANEYAVYGHATFTTIRLSSQGDILSGLTPASSSNRLVLFDGTGTVQDEVYPHPDMLPQISSIMWTDEGGFVVCGMKSEVHELWVSKYDPDGNEAWTYTYDGPDFAYGWDTAIELAMDSERNILAVGSIQDSRDSSQDVWVGKFAP